MILRTENTGKLLPPALCEYVSHFKLTLTSRILHHHRYFIIYHLPNLRFLDSSQISSGEKEAALKCCYWMMGFNSSSGAEKTVTLSSDGSSCERLSEPNGDSSYNGSSTSFQLTTMSARANGHQVQGLQVVNNDVQPKGKFHRVMQGFVIA